jgi:hypothetical protein
LTDTSKIIIVPQLLKRRQSLMVKRTTLFRLGTAGLILGILCVPISCSLLNKPPNTGSAGNILPINNTNADSVGIEIYNVRVAPHQNELLQQLWREVDEQALPPQLRRELIAQGIRVGVQGSILSPALAQLLHVSADTKTDAPKSNDFQEFTAADMMRESATTRQFRTLLPEMRAMIKTFNDPLPELSLFWNENGMFCGQTYKEALGLIFISATANKDSSAQFVITPELEYGVPQQRIRSQAGMLMQEMSRPRRTFESLTVNQRLLRGQWIIMGITALDSTGAGKTFFVRESPVLDQRILAVRFVKATPADSPPPSVSPSVAPTTSEPAMPERN